MDENKKFDVVGTNIAEKATVIWNVADMLRGPFKPHEYGLVILPMTVVKRFHDCLLPTHKAVLEQYEKVKNFAVIDGFLTKASGYQFYNISKYTFESLLADPENIEANFRDYLNGFSANVQDVLAKFDFERIYVIILELCHLIFLSRTMVKAKQARRSGFPGCVPAFVFVPVPAQPPEVASASTPARTAKPPRTPRAIFTSSASI